MPRAQARGFRPGFLRCNPTLADGAQFPVTVGSQLVENCGHSVLRPTTYTASRLKESNEPKKSAPHAAISKVTDLRIAQLDPSCLPEPLVNPL